MLRVGVMVSGGGTNLQAILDAIDSKTITNARVEVVISNNPGAYALERARNHSIESVCMSPREYEAERPLIRLFLQRWMRTGWISLCWQAFLLRSLRLWWRNMSTGSSISIRP